MDSKSKFKSSGAGSFPGRVGYEFDFQGFEFYNFFEDYNEDEMAR